MISIEKIPHLVSEVGDSVYPVMELVKTWTPAFPIFPGAWEYGKGRGPGLLQFHNWINRIPHLRNEVGDFFYTNHVRYIMIDKHGLVTNRLKLCIMTEKEKEAFARKIE